MLSSTSQQAVAETLMLVSAGQVPTERHFKATARAHNVSARTVRRLFGATFDLPTADEVGLSARAALASLNGVDPRVVYASEPAGAGWWPDLVVLEFLAANPTLVGAYDALAAEGRPLPSYAQFTRRVKECLNQPFYAGVCRAGGPNATALIELYVTRAPSRRLEVVELDSFELPVDVLVPRARKARKPWLMVAIDRGTRAVPAWLVVPGRPTAVDARTLLALTIRGFACPDGTVIGGVPQHVLGDNGGEFRGQAFLTAVESSGCTSLPIPAETPHLKGGVERFGQHVEQRLIDHLPGAAHGPRLRGGAQPWRDVPLLTLAELTTQVDRFFADYNTTHQHSGLGGATPLQAWLADQTPVTTLADAQVLRDLLPRETRTVTKKGVELDNKQYLAPALAAWVGKLVQVGWLPRHTNTVEVLTLDGEHVCTAQNCDQLNEDDIADLMTGRRRRGRAVTAFHTGSAQVRTQAGGQRAGQPAEKRPDDEASDGLGDGPDQTQPAPARPASRHRSPDPAGDLLVDLVFGTQP